MANNNTLPAHFTFGPSKAHRWLYCHASVIEEAKYPDTGGSRHAVEGSAAHRFAELALRDRVHGRKRKPKKYIGKKCDETGLTYTREMCDAVEMYIDEVLGHFNPKTDDIYIESKIHCRQIHNELGGTSDCIIVKRKKLQLTRVIVVDFKYGKGITVSARGNEQMLLYATMTAIVLCGGVLPGETTQIIVQPRVSNPEERVTRWSYDDSVLQHFHFNAREAVAAVENLRSEYEGTKKKIPEKYYAPSEKRCTFCKAAGNCKAQDKQALAAIQDSFDMGDDVEFDELNFEPTPPENLSADRLAFVMAHKDAITKWLSDVTEHATTNLMHGTSDIPTHKVVEGRSNRRYKKEYADDPDKLMRAVEKILPHVERERYVTQSPLSVAQMEKLFTDLKATPKLFKKFNSLWEKPPGKPTLVTIDDERRAITTVGDFD